ncbi:MAG: type II toxin-antitoxin system PemK/MazF family toxin [Candidatus Melainabacteria bacterium]|nr:type II toxin-antitoxin system PemK/MazF family toxin [Candidatus Melainabacteria bacterium]
MVDFGNPVGSELGLEHPAVIVSRQEFNNFADKIGRLIIVPGTSTHTVNSKGETIVTHEEVPASNANGLAHTTYFMSEQVRAISIIRCRRLVGSIEKKHVTSLEQRLCLVMDLFKH